VARESRLHELKREQFDEFRLPVVGLDGAIGCERARRVRAQPPRE
jgi:hypothetical protein